MKNKFNLLITASILVSIIIFSLITVIAIQPKVEITEPRTEEVYQLQIDSLFYINQDIRKYGTPDYYNYSYDWNRGLITVRWSDAIIHGKSFFIMKMYEKNNAKYVYPYRVDCFYTEMEKYTWIVERNTSTEATGNVSD